MELTGFELNFCEIYINNDKRTLVLAGEMCYISHKITSKHNGNKKKDCPGTLFFLLYYYNKLYVRLDENGRHQDY